MNLFSVFHLVLVSVFSFSLLFLGTFFLLFLERFVMARAQHRDGPGRKGETDYFQVVWDFFKVREKGRPKLKRQLRFSFTFELWKILPFIFIWILASGRVPSFVHEAEIPILLLLIIASTVTEAILINATEDQREKYDLRQTLLLRVMGTSNFLFCILALILRTGSFELSAASLSQLNFPFLSLFASPALFLCGLSAFGSIYLITASGPVRQEEDISLNGSWHYTFFFVRRLWIFCLIAFWVYLFMGGNSGLLMKLFFPIKIMFALFIFFLLQISLPQSRLADAESMTMKWLLPISLFAFIFEMFWMGAMR